MASIIAQLEIVLLVTAIVGMLARRLRVPITVGLVLAGIGLALVPGAISITLTRALGLPPELPYREEIITTAFVIVAFSIFAQGLTMLPLLRWLREIS
jgi:NhaP-type Na+/H+ or K+/H+ antiporter